MSKRWNRIKGFTLVELLIVVAIVGVLATVGVPTFRKMVQKAKKSEAKVALGGLYTVEAAFFSEYGAYGTNIDKVGFELDGTSATRIYHVGFPTTACTAGITIAPATSTAAGSALNVSFPGYFTSTYIAVLTTTAPGAPGGTSCLIGIMPTNGASFRATANGTISNSSGAPVDQWSISHNRELANNQDGTQ